MRSAPVLVAAVILAAALGLGAASKGAAPTRFGQIDDARMLHAESEPQNWLVHGGNQEAWRFSGLDQINVGNVAQLKPAWVLDFDTFRGQEGIPIVVDGVAYVATANSKVYAVDARTGEKIWYFDPKVSGEALAKPCCDVVNRGVAVYKGKVYIGALDGRLIALDARTGKQLWATQTLPPNTTNLALTGAPRVAHGLVYIGNSGGDFGGRGFVSAYNAETGKRAWKFFLTPGKRGVKDHAASDPIMDKLVQPTWPGPYTTYRGGAQAWNSIVYDPDFDQVYFATGNAYPVNRQFRSAGKGDNLFVGSVLALDAKTGRYKWHYQETPGEEWDMDAVADMVLADLPVDGKMRKVLMHAPKNAVFWELDRKTGKLISGVPFVPGVFWLQGFDKTGKVIVNPAAHMGKDTPGRNSGWGHSWQPTAFSPKTGLVYLQAHQGPTSLHNPTPDFEYIPQLDRMGTYSFGATPPADMRNRAPPAPPNPPANLSYTLAWDPVAQKAAWQTPNSGDGGGVLATAGNLVFQGFTRGVLGEMKAFRADTGEQVWDYKLPNAVITGPVSYMIDGEQYVIVTAGAGAGALLGGGNDERVLPPGRLYAFKIGGTATLPPDPPPVGPPNPPKEVALPAVVAHGAEVYSGLCLRCHGIGARSANITPDLRRSPILTDPAAWSQIVEHGALKDAGMPNWSKFLKPGDAEAIRAYVGEQARQLARAPATVNAGPVAVDRER